MSEGVSERTVKTSNLRGPVEDIPGLTTYLAANFVSLASGGVVAGELFISSGGALYLYDPVVDTDQELTVADGDLFVAGVATVRTDDPRLSDARTPTSHNHTASQITDFSEAVDDEVATLLQAGTNITLNYNDVANTLTINASGGGGGDALTTNPLSQFAATTSAQLAGVISDETGSGALVFANSPTLTTPDIGTATCTKLVVPVTTGSTASIGLSGVASGIIFQSDRVVLLGGSGLSNLIAADNRTQVVRGWFSVDAAGSATSPAVRMGGDTTSGFYRSGSNQVSLAISGVELLRASGTTIASFGMLCAGTYTVATLPTASTNGYKIATVSDSSVTTFGSTVSGGGSSKVMVYSNGTNWTVCAA